MNTFDSPYSSSTGIIQRVRSLLAAAEYKTAIVLLREALERTPTNPEILRMLGYSLMLFDHSAEAIRHLEFSAKLNPGDHDTQCDLAMVYRRLDRLGDAHKALDRVLAVSPGNGRAVALKARVLQARGQSAKAMEVVERSLKISKDPSIVMIYGTLAVELKKQGDAIDLVRETLENPSLERVRRSELLFTLGQLLDSVGEYDGAFGAFDTANKMTDPGEATDFDTHLGGWTKEAVEGFSVQPIDASRSVLVVGMPRSGTTLTEQVIAAHPQAGGVGESAVINDFLGSRLPKDLCDEDFEAGGKRYLESLQEAYPSPKILRVVDKMPENYLFLGPITRMLPGASIVHCRRDARDTCLSIYFQRFGPGLQYAHDLGTCAQQYLGYLRTMEHWAQMLDVPIYENRYEELTANPESHVRSMLDHIGLEFNKSCLEHHKNKSSVHTASAGQIRKPLYKTSRQRWKNYEKHLGPMLEVLGDVE
ncbi:MAG: sulfotransferase [Phycisphaerales bacterium]|nr:sulfotransferase [Phycisphaerales bacterium]